MLIRKDLSKSLPKSKKEKPFGNNIEAYCLKHNIRLCIEQISSHLHDITVYCMDTGITQTHRFALRTHQLNSGMISAIKKEIWREYKITNSSTRITGMGNQSGPITNVAIATEYRRLADLVLR